MKIICTKQEKELLIDNFISTYRCMLTHIECKYHDYYQESCKACLEKNIEWEIETERMIRR